jgi:hypothetical protein
MRCYVITPVGVEGSEIKKRTDYLTEHVYNVIGDMCNIEIIRDDLKNNSSSIDITASIINDVLNSELVIADLTDQNPNVFYEVGLRHSTKKPIIHICMNGNVIPFDVYGNRVIWYKENYTDHVGIKGLVDKIAATISEMSLSECGVALEDRNVETKIDNILELLQEKLNAYPRVNAVFINGEDDAFEALTSATYRANNSIKSSRFFPNSVLTKPKYVAAITTKVLGLDNQKAVSEYQRIVAANTEDKIADVREHATLYAGFPFKLYITPKNNRYELVIIDDKEVFIHFYKQESIIASTLHIKEAGVVKEFVEIWDSLISEDVVLVDFEKYEKTKRGKDQLEAVVTKEFDRCLEINKRYSAGKFLDSTMLNERQIIDVLKTSGQFVRLGGSLYGGVMSSVYEGELISKGADKRIIVKHTGNRIKSSMEPPFHERIDHEIPAESQNLDAHILKFLRRTHVEDDLLYFPDLIHHDDALKISIQEDLRYCDDKFVLLSDLIKSGDNEYLFSGGVFGLGIAKIIKSFSSLPASIKPVEYPKEQFTERGLELLFVYPNEQKYFKEFMRRMTDDLCSSYQIIPTDIHPKNIFYSKNKRIAVIDFGRTVQGDFQYVLPSFLSHIYINALMGKIPNEIFKSFYCSVIDSFSELYFIDVKSFSFYFGVELMHRAAGKYVDYFEPNDIDMKVKLIGLAHNIISCGCRDMSEFISFLLSCNK